MIEAQLCSKCAAKKSCNREMQKNQLQTSRRLVSCVCKACLQMVPLHIYICATAHSYEPLHIYLCHCTFICATAQCAVQCTFLCAPLVCTNPAAAAAGPAAHLYVWHCATAHLYVQLHIYICAAAATFVRAAV